MTICGEVRWTTGENEDSIMKTKCPQIIFVTLSIALSLSVVTAWTVTHANDKDKARRMPKSLGVRRASEF